MDIDLVYLWVDGNDPEFMKRRQKALQTINKEYDIEATSEGRVIQVDELKYSLRSVEKYMPWVHHIFIVTDHQTPKWLNLNNPKISVIDQSVILPKSVKYCYNSNAIESVLYKIPNLAEHFIYANDDMFVNKKVNPNFFFDNKGRCIVRGDYKTFNPQKSLYDGQLMYVHAKIKEKFGIDYPINPHHNFDAYLKSDYEACAKCFYREFRQTVHHPFRQVDSVQRLIVQLYSIAQGHGVFKNLQIKKWYENVASIYISNRKIWRFDDIKKKNPTLFCINDAGKSKDTNRNFTKEFLQNKYPFSSSFENKKEQYKIKRDTSVMEFDYVHYRGKKWFVVNIIIAVLGMSLLEIRKDPDSLLISLFSFLPIIRIRKKENTQRFYLLSLPLFKITNKEENTIFKMFGCIPIFKLKKYIP